MRTNRTFIIKVSIAIVVSVLILSYGLFQARNILIGPQIEVTSPKNGENLTDPLVVIDGIASNIAKITLNDRQIYVDKQGNFKEKLLLSNGYNIIKLAAQDRFGRSTQKLIELNYSGDQKISTRGSATSTEDIIQ